MNKADYNRILSLHLNSHVHEEICVQIIIQQSKNSYKATRTVFKFLKDAGLLK